MKPQCAPCSSSTAPSNRSALINDRETGRPRGFGFVEMPSADAARAIQSLNGKDMGGRPLKVNEAQDKPKGGGRSGGGGGYGGGGRSGGGGGYRRRRRRRRSLVVLLLWSSAIAGPGSSPGPAWPFKVWRHAWRASD